MGKLKVLVLGDGLLGSEIVRQTNCNYLSRKKDGISIDNFDEWLHKMSNYDVIINCIANTNTYSDNKEGHWDINYKFVSLLIAFCNESGKKLVHISTDYVYTDSISNASEEDIPVHCRNWYGYTKLLSDGLVQLQSENFLLCRCTHKSRPFPYESAWIDQVGNFDYVDKISNLIIKLIDNGSEGVYNVGTEIKSMYEMASETRDVGKILTPSHVPKNQTMDLTKLETSLSEKLFFSIAIPTYGYNGRGVEFLVHSLEIIHKQTFKNYEVIISDHSTDDTIKNVYNKWKDRIDIKFYSNDKGRGIISPNINNAMKNCNGEWIKVLFQDDFLYNEESLQIQHDFIIDNPEVNWFMTKFYHSNTGKDYYRLYQPKWMDNQWTGNNLMGCPSGLTIRNRNLLFFDEGLNWLMDVDYYQRMFLKYGKPYILDEITAVNRTWGDRLTDTIPQSLKDKEFNMLKEKYD
jgi:dTDP-4-dehydrorhamnose reductase